MPAPRRTRCSCRSPPPCACAGWGCNDAARVVYAAKGHPVNPITLTPIGTVHSPFIRPAGTPIQPRAAQDVEGTIVLAPEYAAGLAGLAGFSHIIVLSYFHLVGPYKLAVTPFLDEKTHGLFATRAPARPNPIGLSVVELVRIEGSTLHIRNVDIVDGTPVLDIKPYVPAFDAPPASRIGWLAGQLGELPEQRDDGRFEEE
ncbi:MAG: tRNA (N6-threonylcarbamoyladenosine(37)-N6)-methyltransferase TrmO [Anaerolineae bacterium]|nr:tRNA (N6-threonylcarbamoyladenosine(37)-N6)-methyltransferase TrmO [Anaerolineae bacterium]